MPASSLAFRAARTAGETSLALVRTTKELPLLATQGKWGDPVGFLPVALLCEEAPGGLAVASPDPWAIAVTEESHGRMHIHPASTCSQ